MNILATLRRLSNAATVLFGKHGAVSQRAQQQDVSRQSLYRQADAVLRDLDGTARQQQIDELQQQIDELNRRIAQQQDACRQAVLVDADLQARFASTAQAEGVSLPVAWRLLRVFLKSATPSVAQLGRWTRQAAQRAQAALTVLDSASQPLVRQAAADEIFFGRRPCLMLVEQHSMAWLTGRLTEQRNGVAWAKEFDKLPALQQLTRDAGNALGKGVALSNARRCRQQQTPIDDQEDVFHALREGGRPLRRLQNLAAKELAQAQAVQTQADRLRQQGLRSQGKAGVAAKAWRRAERRMEEWSAAEKAWQQVRQALQLFTPTGELNTRVHAEALLRSALSTLKGTLWSKAKRLLQRPQLLTFLDRAEAALSALPLPVALREAAVQIEGLRRHEASLRGDATSSACLRGIELAAQMIIHRSGPCGVEAQRLVRRVLGSVWRASSLVECLNSVARMQQARHRKMTQGLLDLKRWYWNCRAFRSGRRKRQTPYGLLGVWLPTSDWWELLKLPPEQLRQQVSVPRVAA